MPYVFYDAIPSSRTSISFVKLRNDMIEIHQTLLSEDMLALFSQTSKMGRRARDSLALCQRRRLFPAAFLGTLPRNLWPLTTLQFRSFSWRSGATAERSINHYFYFRRHLSKVMWLQTRVPVFCRFSPTEKIGIELRERGNGSRNSMRKKQTCSQAKKVK